MKTFLLVKTKLLFIILSILMLTSCALKPIISEYNFTKKDIENVDINKLGNGNILIYNGANILHTLDNTARLNIWIDNKALGQIKPKEYVIINLKENKYQFKLLHIDVVKFRSLHDIEIDEKTKVIKIKPTIGSNKLEITNELPKRIAKFKHANN